MCIKIRITNIKNISEKCTENVLKISHKLKTIPNNKIRKCLNNNELKKYTRNVLSVLVLDFNSARHLSKMPLRYLRAFFVLVLLLNCC